MFKIGWGSLYQLLVFLLFSGISLTGEAKGEDFNRLDSTFRAISGISTAKEMETLLFEMQSLAKTPREQGITELHYGLYHMKGSRLGLAVIASEKAVEAFDSIRDYDLVIQAQLLQAYTYRKLGNFNKANEIITRLMHIRKIIPKGKNSIEILRVRGALYLDRGKPDSAHYFLEKAIKLARQQKESLEYVMAMFINSIAYQVQGKQKLALQNMLEIKDSVFKIPEYRLHIQYCNFFGMVYMSVKQNKNAIAYYEKAISISKSHNLRWYEGMATNSLAIGLKAIGDIPAAIEKYKDALEIAIELNQLANLSSICSGLADIYIDTEQWEKAGDFAKKGLNYSRQTKEIRMESYALMRIAMVEMHWGNHSKALEDLELADSLARHIGNWGRIKDINEMRSEASEKMGDMNQALIFQRLASSALDSIEYKEAKLYADSLEYSKVKSISAELPQESKPQNFWLWAIIILGIIALSGLFLWKIKLQKPEKPTETQPIASNKEMQIEAASRAIKSLRENKDWAGFMLQFDTIYPGLMETIAKRHPGITPTDLRILALSRLGLSADELGDFLGISPESGKKARYRTRKRLGISADQSLMQYMLQG
ncbi:MAG TPA: hypothetical protein ENJ82_13735 [Bacteroidetes bacterium]|nr:hypothetical protein [Bacteroidota bacterium]